MLHATECLKITNIRELDKSYSSGIVSGRKVISQYC